MEKCCISDSFLLKNKNFIIVLEFLTSLQNFTTIDPQRS